MEHAIIMAGGSGTRLWPASRAARPKQLLNLFDGQSALALAWGRLRHFLPPDRIWVITGAGVLAQVREALPELRADRLIGEPCGRDTSNAIGLATSIIAARDADATIGVFTADHVIRPVERFATTVQRAFAAAAANPEALFTFGVPPTSPHTGYGYLQRGEEISFGVYRVRAFKEKPARTVAEGFLKAGGYYWNSGMFVWRAGALLAELERQLPENAATLSGLAAEWRPGEAPDPSWTARWESLRAVSIDYGVMEGARNVMVVELPCDWLDLGSWTSVAQTVAADARGNAILAKRSQVPETRNTIIASEGDHLIVAFGVEDLVIVHTPDATLVCKREHAERIRELAQGRREEFGERFE